MMKPGLLPALVAAGLMLGADTALARDYILAPARPNKLVVVDTEKMAVDKVVTLDDDAGPMPMTPTVDPTGKFAFVSINKTESIAKVDLISGETVARVDLSTPEMRVKNLFGLALSPDGKTIAAYQSPVKLELAHFEVQPTQITLYNAEDLTPIKTFPAPRQVTLLMFSTDGSKLYGLGRSMYTFDAASGEQLDERPVVAWNTEKYNPSDVLDVWSQYENSGVMVAPFYTSLKDGNPEDPESFRTGLLTLDLATDEMKMRDVRTMDVFYFSTAVSPDKTRAYGVYNVLESFDLTKDEPIKRVSLPHSYYSINVASDNKTIFISGAMGNIAAYDAETLERKADVELPDGASMSLSSVRMFQRDE